MEIHDESGTVVAQHPVQEAQHEPKNGIFTQEEAKGLYTAIDSYARAVKDYVPTPDELDNLAAHTFLDWLFENGPSQVNGEEAVEKLVEVLAARRYREAVERIKSSIPEVHIDQIFTFDPERGLRLADKKQDVSQPQWQDISTAPKDETDFIICVRTGEGRHIVEIACWCNCYNAWVDDEGREYANYGSIVGWMPKPAAPQSNNGEA